MAAKKQQVENGLYYEGNKLVKSDEGIKDAIVRNGTKTICKYAFRGQTKLEIVELPDSLECIETQAFTKCANLKRISIPKNVTKIGDSSFSHCSGLEFFEVMNPKATIPNNIFGSAQTDSLCTPKYGYVPNAPLKTCKPEQRMTFAHCFLTSMERYDSEETEKYVPYIKKVKESMLSRLIEEKNIIGLKNLVKLIVTQKNADDILERVKPLASAELNAAILELTGVNPSNNDKLPMQNSLDQDIYSVTDMKKLWKYKSVFDEKIELNEYKGKDKDVVVPSRIGKKPVTSLSKVQFKNIFPDDINSVLLPDGIEGIGKEAFKNCSSLKKIDIPESVLFIGKNAFNDKCSVKGIDDFELIDGVYYRKEKLKRDDKAVIVDKVFCGCEGADICNDVMKVPMDVSIGRLTDEMPYFMYKQVDVGAVESKVPKRIAIGKDLRIGCFPNDMSMQLAPIEWIAIHKNGNNVLVVTKNIIQAISYNEDWSDTDWEHCSLRRWLNSTFVNNAFSDKERKLISAYETENKCKDEVFILSKDEAEEYKVATIYEMSRGITEPTEFAIIRGIDVSTKYKSSNWWLRDIYPNKSAGIVNSQGATVGHDSVFMKNGLRPAMWIDLSKV